mgnify:CR=1 FL=1
MINFCHSGSGGDALLATSTILSILTQNNQEKANLYFKINKPAYHGVSHPSGNVLLSEKFANQLIPLYKD